MIHQSADFGESYRCVSNGARTNLRVEAWKGGLAHVQSKFARSSGMFGRGRGLAFSARAPRRIGAERPRAAGAGRSGAVARQQSGPRTAGGDLQRPSGQSALHATRGGLHHLLGVWLYHGHGGISRGICSGSAAERDLWNALQRCLPAQPDMLPRNQPWSLHSAPRPSQHSTRLCSRSLNRGDSDVRRAVRRGTGPSHRTFRGPLIVRKVMHAESGPPSQIQASRRAFLSDDQWP